CLSWSDRGGGLPFTVVDQRQAMKAVSGNEFVIFDTPARPDSSDLKELAKGCDLLILPTTPDVISLEPMIETAKALGKATYRALISIVPPPPNREGEAMKADLKTSGIPVFEATIRRTVNYQRAALAGRAICDLPDGRAREAWTDFEALGREIEALI